MWRQVSFNASYLPQGISPRHVRTTGVEAHSHSPRHKTASVRPSLPPSTLGPMLPPDIPLFSRQGACDPFTEPVPHWRQSSSADESMPDYSSSTSQTTQSRRVTDPMITDRSERRYETMSSAGAYESICEALLPSAPDNTPKNEIIEQSGVGVALKGAQAQADTGYYPSMLQRLEYPFVSTDENKSNLKNATQPHYQHSTLVLLVSKVGRRTFSILQGSATILEARMECEKLLSHFHP
jgi:hypothetical protein